MTYDYHKQCLTCNLHETLRNMVDTWTDTYAALSRELFETHNIAISSDALSNHKRFHSDQQQVNVADDVLEEDGIVEVSGVKYFKKLKKQWQLHDGEWRRTYEYVPLQGTEPAIDFKSVIDRVEEAGKYSFSTPRPSTRTVVTQFADLQVGKVDSHGDSEVLATRVGKFKASMEEFIKDSGADNAVFVDNGDVVEGFENTDQQSFTNDLSIMEQIELATILEQELIMAQARLVNHVDVAGVPSNHGAWRKGKGYLGRPGDDWGLFILKQIERAFSFSDVYGEKTTFHFPNVWDKSLSLDLGSEILGITHGDDCGQDQTPTWFAKQVNGGTPISEATILLTGHYHNFRQQTIGTRPDGKSKWWLTGKSMDNGSAWFKNKSGNSESPGVTMFIVDEHTGFDPSSVTII